MDSLILQEKQRIGQEQNEQEGENTVCDDNLLDHLSVIVVDSVPQWKSFNEAVVTISEPTDAYTMYHPACPGRSERWWQ